MKYDKNKADNKAVIGLAHEMQITDVQLK